MIEYKSYLRFFKGPVDLRIFRMILFMHFSFKFGKDITPQQKSKNTTLTVSVYAVDFRAYKTKEKY